MADEKYKALIIDDEPPARSVIRRMLAGDGEIEIIGECSNGIEALELCADAAPDLLFLDIRMPEMNGFELIEAFDEEEIPAFIFVTAYDQYAVRAFEVAAVDYLLKPFDFERLERAVTRAKESLREKSGTERNEKVLRLLEQMSGQTERKLERFVVKTDGRVLLVPAAEIDWIKADGNYLLLYTGGKKHIIRETLKNVEKRLDPEKFFRIHRSTIVNLERIREFQVHFNEKHLVILKDGTELILSRRFRDKLSKKLGAAI